MDEPSHLEIRQVADFLELGKKPVQKKDDNKIKVTPADDKKYKVENNVASQIT